ncbi:MAG: acyltransferase [Gammaproteobacteria bacterium]|nr:acyltransferase [Gammaproteobacteria bacterium]
MRQPSLPPFVFGILSFLFYCLNTLIWGGLFVAVGVLKLLLPSRWLKKKCLKMMYQFLTIWGAFFHRYNAITHLTHWDIEGAHFLNPDHWTLLIGNHQNWVDAIALFEVINGRTSPPRFFAKREILWLPIVGLGIWLGENPLVSRYPEAYLKKHPEKKDRDLKTTREACQKFSEEPVTICNLVEGTRFTPQKHRAQKSPYHHLLKPKAGGIGWLLSALPDKIHEIINLTFVYPDGKKTFWDFLCGRIPRVIIRIQKIPVSDIQKGDYRNDPHYRKYFQSWLNALWEEKDQMIEDLTAPTRRVDLRSRKRADHLLKLALAADSKSEKHRNQP